MKLFDEVFFSFTYGGECIGLTAAKACIEKIKDKKVLEVVKLNGKIFQTKINNLINIYNLNDYFSCDGHPSRTVLTIKSYKSLKSALHIKTFIQQELLKNNILWTGYHCITYTFNKKTFNLL